MRRRTPGSFFDFVDIGAHYLAAKYRTLLHTSRRAYSGSVKSMPKIGLPTDDVRGCLHPESALPIILYSLASSFSFRVFMIGQAAGVAAMLSQLPIALANDLSTGGRRAHARRSTRVSGTPQVFAAAAISICPRRQLPLGASESSYSMPPGCHPSIWLPYFASKSPCSTFTDFQSTSSSSAISIGSMVLMFCPISGFLETSVMVPSGEIRIRMRLEPAAPGVAAKAALLLSAARIGAD